MSKFGAKIFESLLDTCYYYGYSCEDLVLWNWVDTFVVVLAKLGLANSDFEPYALGVAQMYLRNWEGVSILVD